jgi:N-acetylneuraminic acid mutarotase
MRMVIAAVVLASGGCESDSQATVDAPPALVDGPPLDGMLGADSDVPSAWQSEAPVPGGPIQETAVVAIGTSVYVMGGFNGQMGIVDDVRVFDVTTDTWSAGLMLPRIMHHMNAAVVEDTIYVLGGMTTNFNPIGDAMSWNTSASPAQWTPLAAVPANLRGAAVTGAIGTKIYVAGGLAAGFAASSAFSAYETITNTWETTLPPLPTAVDHGCGGVIDGKLYVIGGRAGGIGTIKTTVYEYTPGGAWVEKTPLPTGRGGAACAVHEGTIVVIGGEGNAAAASGVFPNVEQYDAATDTWLTLPPMRTPRHGTGAAVVNGVLYVPGGATTQAFGAVDTHESLAL